MNSKLAPLVEERIKQSIRDMIAIDPLVSVRKIQKALDDKELHCGLEYILKIRKKVHGEAIVAMDRTKAIEALTEVSESYRIKKQQLNKIIFASAEYLEPGTQMPTHKDKIAAIKVGAQMELALFYAKLTIGLFKPKPEDLRNALDNSPEMKEHWKLVGEKMEKWMAPKPKRDPVIYNTDTEPLDHTVSEPTKQTASDPENKDEKNHEGTVVANTGARVILSPFAPSSTPGI